jgi:predicted MPP superfamily phosphohydrolase
VRRRFNYALAIYALAHVYVLWRLVLPLPDPYRQGAAALVAILAPAFPLIIRRAWRRRLPADRATARRWLLLGYSWFGLIIYLVLGALAQHVAIACGAEARLAAQICGGVAIAVVLLGFLNVACGPVVKRVRVPLDQLAVPTYKIVHLTDVHIGAVIGREFAEVLVRRVNALRPDLIVITGDLVDGRLADLRPHIEPLRDLRARDGVYSVTGNHEYYWDVEPWLLHLQSLGMQLLRNEHVTIGGVLALAGTNDISVDEDVARAVAGRDPKLPLVLLAHHPRTVAQASEAGVDLQLSGHTHGGQLLPWGWLARLFDPKVAGLARFDRTWLYVSEGTGFWGPPLRVGTRCEIAEITLVPSA